MVQKRHVQRDGSKETDPNRRVQINWSKKVQIGPIWSKINPKKCPNGSGITRSPGLVYYRFGQKHIQLHFLDS